MMALVPLVVVWLGVLVPQALKARGEKRREFVDSFPRHLEASTRDEQGRAAAPYRRSTACRRRAVFAGLLLSMAVSVVPVIARPTKLDLVVHLAVDNCFLAYVGLLVRWRDRRARPRAAAPAPGAVVGPGMVQPVLG